MAAARSRVAVGRSFIGAGSAADVGLPPGLHFIGASDGGAHFVAVWGAAGARHVFELVLPVELADEAMHAWRAVLDMPARRVSLEVDAWGVAPGEAPTLPAPPGGEEP